MREGRGRGEREEKENSHRPWRTRREKPHHPPQHTLNPSLYSGTVRQTAQKWAQQAGGAIKGFQMPVRVRGMRRGGGGLEWEGGEQRAALAPTRRARAPGPSLSSHARGLLHSLSLSLSLIHVALALPQVDVDFFGPILDTAQRTVATAWRRLPPGAQAATPFAGTALASGGAAWAVQGRRLRRARAACDVADAQVHALTAERGKLQDAIKTLRAGALAPRMPSELKAAAAVAESTAAAAAAASAAAQAAQACTVFIQRGGNGGHGGRTRDRREGEE